MGKNRNKNHIVSPMIDAIMKAQLSPKNRICWDLLGANVEPIVTNNGGVVLVTVAGLQIGDAADGRHWC